MKRSIFKILTILFAFLIVMSCKKEVTTENCTGTDYKIIVDTKRIQTSPYRLPVDRDYVLIQTADEGPFSETITIQLNVRYADSDYRFEDEHTYTVEEGEESGKLLFTSHDYVGDYHYNASITSENCPDPVEKTEDDIVEDSESFSCDENLVEIDELLCDEQYTFTWVAGEGADLTGVTLEAYGQSIDLSAANSASFAVSTLDFTKVAYISNNGTTCYISSIARTCVTEESTGALSLTSPIAAGDDIIIELTDVDLNISADNAETVEVALTTSKGESETVTLTETGNDTGIFSASLTTVLGADAGADNDGSITIELNTEITVVYVDALDAEGNESTEVSETVTVGGDAAPTCSDGIQNGDETGVDCGGSCVPCTVTGATGTLSLTSAIAGGDDFIIELTDADLNITADNAETVEVALTTSKGESETVTLTETGNDTGIFSASLTTVLGADAGADNDGSITIELNTEITVVYVDALDAEGNESTEVSETVTVGGDAAPTCSDGIQNGDETGVDCGGSCVPCTVTSATGALSLTSAIAGGDDIIIELTDADLNITADNAETVEVALATSKGESETVTLTETGNDTGIFSASLTTVLGADAGADNDGSITIELNTEITVVYVDALDAEGNESTEVSETVTVGGDAAPTCSDGIQNGDETGVDCGGSCAPCAAAENTVIFNGTTYSIDDGYYTEYEADLNMDGVNDTYYLLLGLNELVDDGAGGEQYGFAISLELYSDNPITSGTYEFEAEVTGLSNASEVSLNNGAVFHSLTGGTVILTIDGSDYTVEIDATTEGGDLNGTSTVQGF
jgi:hypothetical protein